MTDIALDVRGVRRQFGGLTAVNDVSFEVSRGSVFGIIGPNGAGKTTCFNVVAGDDRATAGEIRLFGKDVTSSPAWARSRAGLARTFQIPQPMGDLTVRENVLIGALEHERFRAARHRASELVEKWELSDYADMPANKMNSATGKRLELARALATGPKLLLLDEPMGGLNDTEVQDTIRLLEGVAAEGVTVVIIEHVLEAVFALCRDILVLNFGSAIAAGTPQEVREHPAVIEAYLGRDDDE